MPAGSHHITFLFDPDSIRKGDAIATACVIVMYLAILALVAGAVIGRIRKKNDAAATH